MNSIHMSTLATLNIILVDPMEGLRKLNEPEIWIHIRVQEITQCAKWCLWIIWVHVAVESQDYWGIGHGGRYSNLQDKNRIISLNYFIRYLSFRNKRACYQSQKKKKNYYTLPSTYTVFCILPLQVQNQTMYPTNFIITCNVHFLSHDITFFL